LDNDPQWRSIRKRLTLTDQYAPEYDDASEDDEDADIYGKEPASPGLQMVDWWVRKPQTKKRLSEPERRHSISHLSEYVGHHVLTPERMQADVDLCGAYFNLVDKQEDMGRIILLLQSLLESTKQTNTTLGQKLFDLELAYAEIDPKALQLNQSTRESRTAAEDATKVANQLDYRTSELEKGTQRLDATLNEYRKRTTDAMILAAAEGANELLALKDDEEKEAAGLVADGSSVGTPSSSPQPDGKGFDDDGLRQRRPAIIVPP